MRATLLAGAAATSLFVPVVCVEAGPSPASASATVERTEVSAQRADPSTKACRAPRPSARTSPKFGVSLSPTPTYADDVATEERRFGRLSLVRVFDPSIPPANAWERRKPMLKGKSIVTSFRVPPGEVLDGKYDAELRRFFRTAPTNREIFWTYIHEPEPEIIAGRFTPRQYRQAWRHIAGIAAGFCKPNLYPTLILTGWTADPASKRDWRTYFPGKHSISVIAWDPYNQAVGTPATYRRPKDVFGSVVRASRSSGLPWGIAETGTARVAGDPGPGRARWITRMGNYLTKRNPVFVSYFQSTNRGDFELRDDPSIAAYRAFVRS